MIRVVSKVGRDRQIEKNVVREAVFAEQYKSVGPIERVGCSTGVQYGPAAKSGQQVKYRTIGDLFDFLCLERKVRKLMVIVMMTL
jgi:hypothetical protein